MQFTFLFVKFFSTELQTSEVKSPGFYHWREPSWYLEVGVEPTDTGSSSQMENTATLVSIKLNCSDLGGNLVGIRFKPYLNQLSK